MNDLLNPNRPIFYRPLFEMRRHNFLLRTIRNADELEEVYRLTYRCYLQKGYCDKSENEMLIHYPQFDGLPDTGIFVVEDVKGQIVGTVSTTKDSKVGLHVDMDFQSESDQVRSEGLSLASCWRIAVDEEHRSKAQVARMLVDGSVAYWHVNNIESCLMTMHPHHENFYKRYLNCHTLSRTEGLKDVHSAAILMRWNASQCPLKKRLEDIINSNKVRIH